MKKRRRKERRKVKREAEAPTEAERKETECSAVPRDSPGHQVFNTDMPHVLIALLQEKRPKNMWMRQGPRGTNGSGNGCHGNGKEKSTKGITNTYECKCFWHWIMWADSLADSNTIFEPEKKKFQHLSHAGFILWLYGKQ